MNQKVGFVSYALDRSPGGIGRYSKELLDALKRAGVPLTVLHAGGHQALDGVVGLKGARLLPGLLTVGQVEIAWQARRRRLEVVHDPTGSVPLLLTGVRRVATIHDVIPYIYPRTSSALDWLIYRCWLPIASRRLDAIITVSNQSKADIVRHLPVRQEAVTVVPEAVGRSYQLLDRAAVQPVLDRHGIKSPYILYVGSIEPRKNLIRLLRAYARFRRWSGRWNLVIVGARKGKAASVYEWTKRLGLQPFVRFTGFLAEEELPALYNGASLFVFPSLYEGFGLPVLEAMACGTPVVTSNTSSLPEVAGDAGLLVDPRDEDAIASAMRRILDDPDLMKELQDRGRQRAKLFTWDLVAGNVQKVYQKVLGNRDDDCS
jgi:glycosyltransferase involved in cell wall biosynthesis